MNNDVEYQVTQYISVGLDESKFTEEIMEDFRKSFYAFYDVNDHRKHLAQLYARGIVDEFTDFIEGYGNPKDFGITFKQNGMDVDCCDGLYE